MDDVVLAMLASALPMGQQEYERQLVEGLPIGARDLSVRAVRVRSLRSNLAGEARLPLRSVTDLPARAQHVAARIAYGAAQLTHRCDLRLPAARREVVTVHDLAPLRFADEGTIAARSIASLRQARSVICPSEFAARELAELCGIPNAIPIPNGIDPLVWADVRIEEELAGIPNLPAEFVLHSGGATERKNLAGLAGAWQILAAEFTELGLVLCGPPDARRDALFEDLPRVTMLGRAPRSVHLALMSAATVVVVPSTYEGFGFPALEAMARGTVVVAANRSALPEVCGEAAVLTEPDAASLAEGLSRALRDESLRQDLESRGSARAEEFTAERSVCLHADVFRAAM